MEDGPACGQASNGADMGATRRGCAASASGGQLGPPHLHRCALCLGPRDARVSTCLSHTPVQVFINSLGQDPVNLNSQPVTSPQELFSGDRIEVRLDDRIRTFFFQGDDETVKVQAPTRALQHANRALNQAVHASPKPASARKRTRKSLGPSGKEDVAPASPGRGPAPAKKRGTGAPPPPPPPLPSGRVPSRAPLGQAAPSAPPPPAPGSGPAPGPRTGPGPARFVPSAADLVALKAGERRVLRGEVVCEAAAVPLAIREGCARVPALRCCMHDVQSGSGIAQTCIGAHPSPHSVPAQG